jgi:hypothetical protein
MVMHCDWVLSYVGCRLADYHGLPFVRDFMNNFVTTKTEMGPKTHKCIFKEQLQKEFPFITKTNVSDSYVRCNACESTVSISHSGRGNIKTHLNSDKHKRTISAAACSSSLTTYFRPERIGNEEEQLAATEGALAYHTVSHSHSFRFIYCTSKLFQIT